MNLIELFRLKNLIIISIPSYMLADLDAKVASVASAINSSQQNILSNYMNQNQSVDTVVNVYQKGLERRFFQFG